MKDCEKPFCVVRDDGWIYSFNKTRDLAQKTVDELKKYYKTEYRVEANNGKSEGRWFVGSN